MLLGDFGADVVKIEPPGGENARVWGSSRFGPDDQFSAMFLAFNRNKASVVLDLKSDAGRRETRRLLEAADVVVENFRPGVAERLGVGYRQASEARPDVVYCSISGFGQTGPLRDRPGYDMLMQAYAGHMSLTGEEGRESVRVGHSAVDILAGTHAALGILLALRHRDATGEGQQVDTSLYDASLQLISHFIADYTGTGRVPRKSGGKFPFLAPYGVFRASDREFYMGVSSDRVWLRLCESLGREDLARDERFATNRGRVGHSEQLYEALEPTFAAQPADHWVALCVSLGIPTSLVHDLGEVAEQEQAMARELLADAGADGVRTTGLPIKLSRTPGRLRRRPPRLGEDNDAVLDSSVAAPSQ